VNEVTTRKVKLTSARCGHKYDSQGRFIGVFAEAAGQIVDMPTAEAERYLERGLAVLPDTKDSK
jgi:hypothetical protein